MIDRDDSAGNGADADPTGDTSDDDRDPVDLLAEEFAARLRRGERPSVTEYRQRYPEHAAAIDDLFPTLEMMEDLKPNSAGSSSSGPVVGRLEVERLGDYRIEREVGRGGMGIVYEAVQESLDRRVALKVLPSSSLFSRNTVERFHREARAAAQLHHTNIVPVYGVGEEAGTHYFVMQYIEGRSVDAILRELRERVRAHGSGDPQSGSDPAPAGLPELSGLDYYRAIARVGEQVAGALAYAHTHGTLHRDIKPGNLILDREGNVWVADFGLAKHDEHDDLTQSGSLLGTLRYTAPEQIAGESSPLSDVYALGITLYELVTLQPAFADPDRRQLLHRIVHEELPPARRRNPAVPVDLDTVIQKAIAKEPARRYANATEFAADLRRVIDGVPVRARRIGPRERILRWYRRNRALSWTSSVAAASLLVAAITGWIGYVEATAALERESENVELSLGALAEIFDSLAPTESEDQLAARSRGRGRDPGPRRGGGRGAGGPGEGRGRLLESVIEERETAVLTSILGFYDRFAAKNETNAELRLEAAQAYRRVCDLHRRRGRDTDARTAALRSAELLERLVAEEPNRTDGQIELANVHCDLAELEDEDEAHAEQHLDRAIAIADALTERPSDPGRSSSAGSTRPRASALSARILAVRGRRHLEAARYDAAITDLEAALAHPPSSRLRPGRLGGRRTPSERPAPDPAEIRLDLARAYLGAERYQETVRVLRPILEVRRGPRPGAGPIQILAEAHALMATALDALEEPDRATEHRERVRELEPKSTPPRN